MIFLKICQIFICFFCFFICKWIYFISFMFLGMSLEDEVNIMEPFLQKPSDIIHCYTNSYDIADNQCPVINISHNSSVQDMAIYSFDNYSICSKPIHMEAAGKEALNGNNPHTTITNHMDSCDAAEVTYHFQNNISPVNTSVDGYGVEALKHYDSNIVTSSVSGYFENPCSTTVVNRTALTSPNLDNRVQSNDCNFSDLDAISYTGPICRICHLPGEKQHPLISPCRCSGTLQFIHTFCLTVSVLLF